MSGGVDSSLTAALLKEQNYDIVGVYMKNWTQDLPGMKCPWADDLADAKRVAVQLGIPFEVFDFQKEYKQKVVEYMIDEYEKGHTPNPDIMCNQEIKFKLFLETALADGAEMIATGHYARTEYSENDENHANLLRAKDENKDQTYFLYRVTEKALEKTLFPLGDFVSKNEVRKEAEKRGLATARKKDSQGICFVGEVGVRDFLSQFITTESGAIIEQETGCEIGHHDGAIFYTFGQRHGLNLGGGLPFYVVGKNMAKNEIYVSRNLNNEEFFRDKIELIDTHWINNSPEILQNYEARFRHRGQLVDCKFIQINTKNNSATIELSQSQRAIASGQSVVIYRGNVVIGGGIIL